MVNGSPIGDSMPLLIALGASVVLMSVRGQMQRRANRTLCVEEYGDLVDPGFTPVHFFRAFEAQADSRAAIGFRVQAGVRKVQRL